GHDQVGHGGAVGRTEGQHVARQNGALDGVVDVLQLTVVLAAAILVGLGDGARVQRQVVREGAAGDALLVLADHLAEVGLPGIVVAIGRRGQRRRRGGAIVGLLAASGCQPQGQYQRDGNKSTVHGVTSCLVVIGTSGALPAGREDPRDRRGNESRNIAAQPRHFANQAGGNETVLFGRGQEQG